MNLLKVFFVIIFGFAQTKELNEIMRDELVKKFEMGNYHFCDKRKDNNYMNIHAAFYSEKYNIEFFLKTPREKRCIKKLTIPKENKSFEDIIKKIEDNIKTLSNDSQEYTYLFYCEDRKFVDSITENLVEKLKEINALRRIDRQNTEIYYENIFYGGDILQKIMTKMKTFKNGSITEPQSSICYYDELWTHKKIVLLIIDIEDVLYFFEFAIDELFNKVDVKIFEDCSSEEKILQKILDIHKLSQEKFDLFINNELEAVEFDSSCIFKRLYDQVFKISIEAEKVIFYIENKRENTFQIENSMPKNKYKDYISKNCYMEFQRIFSRLSNTDYIREIELFYDLLKNHNKMEFFIGRILNKPGSSLNMIFAWHLFGEGLTHHFGSGFTIGDEGDSRRFKLTKELTELIENKYNGIDLYVVIICLIFEAEIYIQEDDLSDDKLCKTLTEIGEIIAERDATTDGGSSSSSTEGNIDLFEILEEMVILYDDALEIYNENIPEKVEELIEKKKIKKETAVQEFDLNASELEKNMGEFFKKLKEKSREFRSL
ncbi:uncharacterized protein VNE69_05087 [Vairimorpha necatrix]|uniref:Uncharacterized protein n=1 Tax=Vairimorpha necatrix TaxID=6039 RepID=A0AAX4JBZ4_9MICR